MRHKRLMVIITSVMFFIVCVLCFSSLFKVTDIVCEGKFASADAEYSKLFRQLDKYEGENLLFFDTKKVAKEFDNYKSLKIKSVEKKYPNKIIVHLEEREKVLALESGDSYFLMDEGCYVVDKVDKEDGYGNCIKLEVNLLSGFSLDGLHTGERLAQSKDKAFVSMQDMLGEISNPLNLIKGITIEEKEKNTNYYITFEMRTGVVIEIRNATDKSTDKISEAIRKYNGLEDINKITGKILVYESEENGIEATYSTQSIK